MPNIENSPTKPSGAPKKKVLAIDDSPIVLSATEEHLTAAGFDVKTVLYPKEMATTLVVVVADYKPDLVLCDIDMPLLPGDRIAKIIKSNMRLKNTKLYFYSSRKAEELEAMVKTAAAEGYIRKTGDARDLLAKVAEILK